MKKLIFLIALMMPMASNAQNEESAISSRQTTFEKFTSTIGTIVKFKDYKQLVVSDKK